MNNPQIFWFGKYRGKGIEQVALKDYGYLGWLTSTEKTGELSVKLSQPFRDRLTYVAYNLDNFVPNVKCEDCKGPAKNLSFVDYRKEKCLTERHFYCGSSRCAPESDSRTKRLLLVPLRVSSILRYPNRSDAAFVAALHNVLAYAAGWPDGQEITEESARTFVEKLQIEHPETEPRNCMLF